MRKLSLVLAVACAFALLASPASAIDAGKWRIGGSSSGSYVNLDGDSGSTTTMDLTVQGGYLVAENIEVGLGISYTSTDNGTVTDTVTTIEPYGRYYFPAGDNAFFVGLGYDMITIADGTNVDITGFFGSVGYSVKATSDISVDIALNYGMATAENGGSEDITITTFAAGVSLWL